MEKISQPKIEPAPKNRLEDVADMGSRAMEKESARKIPPHRKRGFMLTTFVAMGLALAGAGQAEAQSRINAGRIGGEIINRSITASRNAFEMRQNQKILEVHARHQAELNKLIEDEGRLDEEFHRIMLELQEKRDTEGLRNLLEEYNQEKLKFKQARVKLDRDRDVELHKVRAVKRGIGGGIGVLGR